MDLSIYSKEIDNYVDGQDASNYLIYYSQRLESDARAYAKANTQIIFDRIDKYLQEQAKGDME